MKILTTTIAILLTLPAFADITNESSCDNNTLNSYAEPVDMTAKWTQNRIDMKWYNDGDEYNENYCMYDNDITLPPDPPAKIGYVFGGWQVRQAFDLSTLSAYIENNGNAHISRSVPNISSNHGNPMCVNGGSEDRTCSDAIFSDLDNGEWKVPFNYGTVRGVALCSSTNGGTWANTGTPDETGTGSTTRYCWCKASGFAEPNSSTYTNVASPSWVFLYDFRNAGVCAPSCADYCAYSVRADSDFRRAVYGLTE